MARIKHLEAKGRHLFIIPDILLAFLTTLILEFTDVTLTDDRLCHVVAGSVLSISSYKLGR